MKKLLTLLLMTLMGISGVWASVTVPTPVYFNDFSSTDGLTVVGSGEFITDADSHFGQIYHNDPNLTKSVRTNYLKLPTSCLDGCATNKAMTIGFWVNKKSATDYFYSPIFTAYGAAPDASTGNTWPMFCCTARGTLQENSYGYCDFGSAYNDKVIAGSATDNAASTAWSDDGEWHYFTITLTETTAAVYVDGNVLNSWTVDGTSDGQVISGLFLHPDNTPYICLGGNQAWAWTDPDPAFGFDDFAVYSTALTPAQIKQIIYNKTSKVGQRNSTTGVCTGTYDSDVSSSYTLESGKRYHFSYINYNSGTTYGNWYNWVLGCKNGDTKLFMLRNDNYEDVAGANTNCVSNFDWDNFMTDMNGATVDMYVTFVNSTVTVSSTITTTANKTYTYSYTKSDVSASSLDLYFTVNASQIVMNSAEVEVPATMTWDFQAYTKTKCPQYKDLQTVTLSSSQAAKINKIQTFTVNDLDDFSFGGRFAFQNVDIAFRNASTSNADSGKGLQNYKGSGARQVAILHLNKGDKITFTCTESALTFVNTLDATYGDASTAVAANDQVASGTEYTIGTAGTLAVSLTKEAGNVIHKIAITNSSFTETVTAPTITSTVNGASRDITIANGASSLYSNVATYYTTDGTDPTTSSTLYTGLFNVTEACTVKAITVSKSSLAASSSVASQDITPVAVTLSTPTLKRTANATVTISSDQSTVEGTPTPTYYYYYGDDASAAAVCTSPLTLTEDGTLHVYATATGYTNSEATSLDVAVRTLDYNFIQAAQNITYTTGARAGHEFTNNKITYDALVIDGKQWGGNRVYVSENFSIRNGGGKNYWYTNNTSYVLMENMHKGDIIYSQSTIAPTATNATANSAYSYGNYNASFVVDADGDVILTYKKGASNTMNYISDIQAYTSVDYLKAGEELIANGTFDSTIKGWISAGTQSKNDVAQEGGTGFWYNNGFAEMYANGAEGYSFNDDCYISQTVSNLPAGYYKVSAKLVSNGTNKATFTVNDGTTDLVSKQYERGGEWIEETYVANVATDGGALTVKYVPESDNSYWVGIDDVSMTYLGTDESYAVFFNTWTTSAPEAQIVTAGGKATKPADPSRSGYQFFGWYTKAACADADAFDFDNKTISANTELYAKWVQSENVIADIDFSNTFTSVDGGYEVAGKTAGKMVFTTAQVNTDNTASDVLYALGYNGSNTEILHMGGSNVYVPITDLHSTKTDVVKVEFDVYYGRLTGEYFQCGLTNTASNALTNGTNCLGGFRFDCYNGDVSFNTVFADDGGDLDDGLITGVPALGGSSVNNNDIVKESNRTHYILIYDFKNRTVKASWTGNFTNGVAQAGETGYETMMPALDNGDISSSAETPLAFVFGTNYDNSGRRMWLDNVTITDCWDNTETYYTASFTETASLTPTIKTYFDEDMTKPVTNGALEDGKTYYFTASMGVTSEYSEYVGSFTVGAANPAISFTMVKKNLLTVTFASTNSVEGNIKVVYVPTNEVIPANTDGTYTIRETTEAYPELYSYLITKLGYAGITDNLQITATTTINYTLTALTKPDYTLPTDVVTGGTTTYSADMTSSVGRTDLNGSLDKTLGEGYSFYFTEDFYLTPGATMKIQSHNTSKGLGTSFMCSKANGIQYQAGPAVTTLSGTIEEGKWYRCVVYSDLKNYIGIRPESGTNNNVLNVVITDLSDNSVVVEQNDITMRNGSKGLKYFVLTMTNDAPVCNSYAYFLAAPEYTLAQLSISKLGWGTFIAPYECEIPSGVTAYTITGTNGNILVKGAAVTGKFAANTPYLVKSGTTEAPTACTKTYTGIATNGSTTIFKEGFLTGNLGSAVDVDYNSGTTGTFNYLLQYNKVNGAYKLGFYKVAATGLKVGKNRCYLTREVSSGAKIADAFYLFEEDIPTDVSSVEAASDSNNGVKKYFKNGQLFIETANGTFSAAGNRIK